MALAVHRARQRQDGVGSCGRAHPFLGQDFAALRDESRGTGGLFQDSAFPATTTSLGHNELGAGSQKIRGVEWRRPRELCSDPKFIVDGASRTDICQGALGDCWLLAAIASLTLNAEVMSRVVPLDQGFEHGYCGIFHFQFWQFGEWVDVVIDDRLPSRDGELLFVHSAERGEFWSALLEKAYAKLNGSYEALSGGSTTEGFEDFTGGVAEWFELKTPPPDLFSIIRRALERGSLMGCSIDITNASETEAVTSQKLVKGHAYSMTGAEEVMFRGGPAQLVRIRNPWGEVEWTGAWSDSSAQWSGIEAEDRDRLRQWTDDGEFWMSFNDFLRHYSRLEICNLTPDTLSSGDVLRWNHSLYSESWRRGSTAGGCRNYPGSFWTNPQFKVVLEEGDEDGSGECSMVLALIQKNRRQKRKMGEDMRTIGFAIYDVPAQYESVNNVHLPRSYFTTHGSRARSESFINLREVCGRYSLPPGQYLVVPSTFEPNQDADFALRVFTQSNCLTQPMDINTDGVSATFEDEAEVSEDDVPDNFKALFNKLAGPSGEITVFGLQRILNKVVSSRSDIKTDGFGLETCRNMVNLLDRDGNGQLGLLEFKKLWDKIQKFLKVYKRNDLDGSGTMSSSEMRVAVEESGFQLNNQLTQILVARYSDSEQLVLDFDNFVSCLIRLEAVFKMFNALPKDENGNIELGMFQWLTLVLG